MSRKKKSLVGWILKSERIQDILITNKDGFIELNDEWLPSSTKRGIFNEGDEALKKIKVTIEELQ